MPILRLIRCAHLALCGGLLLACTVVGCSGPSAAGGSNARPTPEQGVNVSARDGAWAIALAFYSGAQHRAIAMENAPIIAQQSGRTDLRVRSLERGSVIVAGTYRGPGDPNAMAELERLKGIAVGDARPFASAYLAPPVTDSVDARQVGEFDLRGAKARFGEKNAVYTLEFTLYNEGGARDYRSAAERTVLQLRGEGETAFYYHGNHSSVVTLGLFGDDAIDPRTNRYSPAVDALQRRFKFAMVNDEKAPVPGQPGTFHATKLVRVPE